MHKLITRLLPFALTVAAADASSDTLSYAVLDYCPYTCNLDTAGKEGIALEIHRRIFEKAGYDISVTFLPWARVIYGIETGQYDATPIINAHHSKLVVLSEENPVVLKQQFYVKKGSSWRYEGIPSLDGLFIGNVIGYNYQAINPEYEIYCKANETSGRIQYATGVDAQEKNIKKLLAGRIDTFNEDAGFMFQLAQKMGVEDKLEKAGILGVNPQFAGFSPKRPDAHILADIFDRGIRELRESGELKQMLAKYGIDQ